MVRIPPELILGFQIQMILCADKQTQENRPLVSHIGSSNGKLAPKSVQKLLTDKDVINAIAKGLKILGY